MIQKLQKEILENIEILFLTIYFLSLPIKGMATLQSVSCTLFIIIFLIKYYKEIDFKQIFFYKNIIFVFLSLLCLTLVSLFFTPEVITSIKEIKSEIIRNFILLYILFLYVISTNEYKIKYIFYSITFVVILHTLINLYVWYTHGMWPYRAGGLLDSGGGERFGIWATYALAISMTLLFFEHKKYFFLIYLLCIISIFANQTRATFLATILITLSFLIFFIKNKFLKFFTLIFLIFLFLVFYFNSNNFSQRYNMKNTFSKIEVMTYLKPNQYKELEIKYHLDASIVERLSMWKSVFIYRLNDPFIPQGYGRYMYDKKIKEIFQNTPENIPYVLHLQVHNDFIGIFFELGIFGLIILLYFLFYQLKITYKIFKNSKKDIYKKFSIFIFLGTIGFMCSMMFGSFFGDSEAKFFYSLYGIILGINYKFLQIEQTDIKF